MKKLMFILLLVLVMASSLVAGTLARYTTSIDNMAEGSVVAKEFVFVGEGTDNFRHGVKIAPAENVQWQFKVKNHENNIITETDLYYRLTFNVKASDNKSAILPLTVAVKDSEGNIINSVTGIGTFYVYGSFPLSENGQDEDYIVEIYWPEDGSSDINYAGSNYGTSIDVDATASQLPFNGSNPGNEDPDEETDISVRYETTASWQNGQSGIYEFEYKITITNNSDEAIEDWNIAFSLPTDRLSGAWSNARAISGLPEGSYKFVSPNYNNTATDDILPGRSVSFSGPARGRGNEAITNISVGGSNVNSTENVELTYEFGKASLN